MASGLLRSRALRQPVRPLNGAQAMMTRRTIRLAPVLAALWLLGAPALATERVTLAQNLSPISGVTIVAKQRGLFLKHGLDVQVSNFTTGKQCLDTVIGGAAEIATTAEAPTT